MTKGERLAVINLIRRRLNDIEKCLDTGSPFVSDLLDTKQLER
jgi:hypothetical protein